MVHPLTQAIGEFFTWLQSEKGYVIAEWHKEKYLKEEQLWAAHFEIEKLLAEHFELDLDRMEAEKRHLLEVIGRINNRSKPNECEAEDCDDDRREDSAYCKRHRRRAQVSEA